MFVYPSILPPPPSIPVLFAVIWQLGFPRQLLLNDIVCSALFTLLRCLPKAETGKWLVCVLTVLYSLSIYGVINTRENEACAQRSIQTHTENFKQSLNKTLLLSTYTFTANLALPLHFFSFLLSDYAIILTVVLSVSCLLSCLYRACCLVCIVPAVLFVSCLLSCMYPTCCAVCIKGVILSVSCMLSCLYSDCCLVCVLPAVWSVSCLLCCLYPACCPVCIGLSYLYPEPVVIQYLQYMAESCPLS